MKTCTRCLEPRDDLDFHFRNTVTGKRQRICKGCVCASTQKYQRAHQDRLKAYNKEYYYSKTSQIRGSRRRTWGNRHAGIREFMDALKSNPCSDCKQTFPPECMDLDHVRGAKCFNFGAVRGTSLSDDVLLDELMKCELVCSNCHRTRTKTRRKQAA